MKKLRKITALLVVMVMALSLIPQAVLGAEFDGIPEYTTAYADSLLGWNQWYVAGKDESTYFSCVTDEIAYDGSKSVVLRHADRSKNYNALSVVQEGLSLTTGTYTLSFWAAGTRTDVDMQFVTMNGDAWTKYPMNGRTAEEIDGDWSKYTIEMVVPDGKTNNTVVFGTDGDTEGWYIDDVSLVRVGTTENLLTNGSFGDEEAEEEPEEPEEPEYTTALEAYFQGWEKADGLTQNGSTVFSCVTDEIAHSGSNSVVLRHEDASQYERDLKIKQGNLNLGAGTYTLSFWAAGTVAKQVDDALRWQQIVWMPNVGEGWFYVQSMNIEETDGDWSKYSMDFTVESGKTVTEMSISIRGWATGLYLDDISIVAQGTTENLLTNGGFEGTESGEEPEVPKGPEYTDAYEAYFQGWERDTAIAENGTTIFTCVTDEIAHSGDHSFVLKSLDTGDKDLALKQTVGLGEGTYTLSFWAAGTAADHDDDTYRYQQMVWLWGSAEQWAYLSNMYTGEKDGDWAKYTLNFTVPAGATVSEFKLSTRGHGTEGLYIDDISIVKSGTTNNILSNGGFEEKVAGEDPDVPEGPEYTDAYEAYFTGWARNGGVTSNTTNVFACVTDEIAHSGEHSVVLKHTDSTQGGYMQIQQTSLSLSEGTYTLSFWVSGEVNGQQVIWIKPGTTTANGDWLLINSAATGETEGAWTKYSTTFNVESGNTVTELTFGTSGNTDGLYLDDIRIVAQGDDTNLLTNGGFEGTESGEDPEVPGVPEGPTYTEVYEEYFSGWGRGDEVTQNESTVFACVTNDTAHSGSNSILLKHIDSDQSGYIQIQQTSLSLSEGTYTLSFWVAGEVNGKQVIWIKPGPTTANGDWLLINSAATGEVEGDWAKYSTNFTVEPENTVTQLTFGTNGDTTGLYIDDISVVAQGKTENLLKNGSFEERDSGAPVGDVVKEVVLKKNGQRIDTLDGQGDYSVTLILDNYAINTELDVEQLVAIYDEDGVLYGTVHSTATSIEKATADGAFTKIETSFTLPAGNYTVEYFVFDGRDTLNIIGSPNPHRIFE